VGDELTDGRSRDAHVSYLATFFRERAFRVRRAILVPDDQALYAEALREAAAESEVVICTGGLGPTQDDLTREVIASVAGRELVYQQELWDALVARRPDKKISETNKKQAYVPEGFEIFPNPRGTAVGFVGPVNGALVAALPGPPNELHGMVHESLDPYLAERTALTAEESLAGTSFAIAESDLEESLQRHAPAGISWGTKAEELRIAFSLRGGTGEERAQTLARLQEEWGSFHIREGDVDPVGHLFDRLKSSGRRLVTAESCTGGLVAKVMTDRPGSSEVFCAGFVVYENEAKEKVLGVSGEILARYGAVSRETVEAMADAAVGLMGRQDTLSVAISGVAGPSGGTEEKPVGTVWIAASDGRSRVSRGFRFLGSRVRVRLKATAAALLLVGSLVAGDNG
jgi:nicotinamide-nucleotide amidase